MRMLAGRFMKDLEIIVIVMRLALVWYCEVVAKCVDNKHHSFIESLGMPTASGMVAEFLRMELDWGSTARRLMVED